MDQVEFEQKLIECKTPLERFVRFKISNYHDVEDILQEVYLSASRHYHFLHEEQNLKAWLIKIAANKCNDYYRAKSKHLIQSIDTIPEIRLCSSIHGLTVKETVYDTLELLADKDSQILTLYYLKNKPQSEIALLLGIPIGTVKSRLFTAKAKFKEKYPYPPKDLKGDISMKTLPDYLPEYKIEKLDTPIFPAKWEEIMGMFIIPRVGEKMQWAMYDMPDRAMTGIYNMEVCGKALIHGIEGVEIKSDYRSFDGSGSDKNHIYIAQLTETHCRYLAEIYVDKFGVRHYLTFLDSDDFIEEWGMGEDNCGKEINVVPKGIITRNEANIICNLPEAVDSIGRYQITFNNKMYDTVCVMDIEIHNSDAIATEQYIDANGRTVLWRRFNRDDWAIDRYKQRWSVKLPDNERITINGEMYVHWYDCITSYIL